MTFNIFLVVCGFAVLVFGADMLVRGASRLASAAAAPALVSGLTIVAFGSMPIMESPIR